MRKVLFWRSVLLEFHSEPGIWGSILSILLWCNNCVAKFPGISRNYNICRFTDCMAPLKDALRAELFLKALGFYDTYACCKLQSFFLSFPSFCPVKWKQEAWNAPGFCVLRWHRWQGIQSAKGHKSSRKRQNSLCLLLIEILEENLITVLIPSKTGIILAMVSLKNGIWKTSL